MDKKLLKEAIFKFLLGLILLSLLVFIPAGTIYFINGWLFMIALFIPMLIIGIIMFVKVPDLLRLRLESKEKQKEQNVIIKLSGLMFLIAFIVAGLDFRYNLTFIPSYLVYISTIIFLIGYAMYFIVLKQNTYLSRTIKVEEGQTVVDTGLYGVVRHPMYMATLLMFLSMPLILGSLVSFFVFLMYPILIGIRAVNEEKLLEKELKGYKEYKQKVKYRIIPFIW